jgi:hypothetical protein
LEGCRRLNTFNARSDKSALVRPYEPKQQIGAVRMAAGLQAIPVAIPTTITSRRTENETRPARAERVN